MATINERTTVTGRHCAYCGHAVTDDVWYEDVLRVEYRMFF